MNEAAKDPGVYTNLSSLIALEGRARRVSFLPRQPAHSLLSGRYASKLRGRGLNFEEIRGYLPGDDVRSIDWKVTARLQHPHVRIFNEERDRQALVLVDQRLSMFFGSRRSMKSVTAAEVAAVAAWRILAVGDRLGGIVFSDTTCTEIKPQRSRRNALRLLEAIVRENNNLAVDHGIQTSAEMLNRTIDRAHRLASHDATVVIISDFHGADETTRRLVGAMASHVDVIGILIHDPLQSQLPPSGKMVVTDGELQVVLDTAHSGTRSSILQMSENRLRDLFRWTSDFGIPIVPVSTDEDAVTQINHLLGRAQQNSGRRSGTHG